MNSMKTWLWLGAGALTFGALMLTGRTASAATPGRSPAPSTGIKKIFDPVLPPKDWRKARSTPRGPATVNTIIVHQTAIAGGFGVSKQQLEQADGDRQMALRTRYRSTPYHAIYSPQERISVVQWPVTLYSYHGHKSNKYSVGWAYDGQLPGDKLDVMGAREAFAHAVVAARSQGSPIRYVGAHRQHSKDRGGDPGAEIWREVVLPMLEVLDLEVSDKITGTGSPIPDSWS